MPGAKKPTKTVEEEQPAKPREWPSLRDEAGGVVTVPPISEVLERRHDAGRYESKRNNQFNASSFMTCFRMEWFRRRKLPCDHDLDPHDCMVCRFSRGKAMPGNATEDQLRQLLAEELNDGKEGVVLNDLRFSEVVDVEWEEDDDGKVQVKQGQAVMVSKADPTIIGDNLRVLTQYEVKSPIKQFHSKFTNLTKQHGDRVPLSIAGVDEPENKKGACSVHHLTQLAFTCHKLRQVGNTPKMAILLNVSRANFEDNIEVVITPDQNEHLYNLAKWWVVEAYINDQFDEPPPPEFFKTWECGVACSYPRRCNDINEATGEKNTMHPIMYGLNERLKRAEPFEEPEDA